MNFLAHLYLSGDDEYHLIGNFMGDSIKGRKALEFLPERIKHGVLMHREIDHYMDTHPIVREGASRIRNDFGKFAPIVMDMYYDHFLSVNWEDHSDQHLDRFIQDSYAIIEEHKSLLPDKARRMFPYMRSANWLAMYGDLEGLDTIFQQMDRRTGHLSGMHRAIEPLERDYNLLQDEFSLFFEQIKTHLQEDWKPE